MNNTQVFVTKHLMMPKCPKDPYWGRLARLSGFSALTCHFMLTLRSQSSWITNGGISFRTLPCTYVVSTQWFLLHFLHSSKTISIWEFVRQINMHSRCCFLFIHFCPKSANVLKLEGENRFLAVKLRSSSICHSNVRYAMLTNYITISSWMTKSMLG